MKRCTRYVLLTVFLLSMPLVLSCQSPVTPPVTPSSPTLDGSPSVSNGRSIYFNSTSAYGDRITYTGGPATMMQGPLSCANCHGSEGHGGTVQFMMQSVDVPDITWPELTGQHTDHQPYTEETVKQAITKGVDPAGNPLEYPMPRWQMYAQDLNDLVGFIKTLK